MARARVRKLREEKKKKEEEQSKKDEMEKKTPGEGEQAGVNEGDEKKAKSSTVSFFLRCSLVKTFSDL